MKNQLTRYIISENLPIKYYTRKYGDDTTTAFIHLIREIGQIAFAIEAKNSPVLEAKLALKPEPFL